MHTHRNIATLASSIVLSSALWSSSSHAQSSRHAGYTTHARLAAALDSIKRASPDLVSVTEIAKSPGGRGVHVVRVGRGANVEQRPALLIVANAHGPHVIGSEIALGALRRLIAGYGKDTAVTRLLDRNTLYVVPRANPDAAEEMFGPLAFERTGNTETRDDDHDGVADEDGGDDLNGDGMITVMRVEDPSGEWFPDPVDPFLMRRADATKGEKGRYRIYVEGKDDDKDERYNEDGKGGTDVNRNFPNFFEFFSDAGTYPLSSAESRGIAELFQEHQNIAAVYVLGPQDNLNTPWVGRRIPGISGNPQGTSAGGPFTATLPEDDAWFAEVSKRFKRITGWQKGPSGPEGKGDPLTFAYYDMGRFAFGSRGWWAPDVPADTAKAALKPETPDPIADERNTYRWLKANRPEAIIEWKRVEDADFPGKVVEVGGIAPFATLNPPAVLIDSVVAKHTRFVEQLTGMLPSLELRAIDVTAVGPRVWRINAEVANTGYLPTLAAIGARARWARRVRVELKVTGTQSIASGRNVQLLDAMRGSGTATKYSWVVVGDAGSTVTLSAGSPVTGDANQTITLRAK